VFEYTLRRMRFPACEGNRLILLQLMSSVSSEGIRVSCEGRYYTIEFLL